MPAREGCQLTFEKARSTSSVERRTQNFGFASTPLRTVDDFRRRGNDGISAIYTDQACH